MMISVPFGLLSLALPWISQASKSPTCYEYWDAKCSTGVRNTYHELTGGNCSRPDTLGTACLTSTLVALTQVEANTCRKTFGSVQTVSECMPLGRRGGRDLWMYCTKTGCDDLGETCDKDKVEQPGSVKLWDTCGGADVYPKPLPSDGECYALPDAGASVRVTCLNNLYMQVQIYHDLACEVKSPFNQAPTFLQQGGACYKFQGATTAFEMTVESGCSCGDEQTPADTGGYNDGYGDDVLRFDLMYNVTLDGANCLEGNGLINFEAKLEEQTSTDVEINVGRAILSSERGMSWWELSLGVRFRGIPQPRVIEFQEDVDAAFIDGRVLGIINDTCGGNGNVTMVNHGSTVWDHESTRPPVSSASLLYMSLATMMMTLGVFSVLLQAGW